jgi:hypothetical protein
MAGRAIPSVCTLQSYELVVSSISWIEILFKKRVSCGVLLTVLTGKRILGFLAFPFSLHVELIPPGLHGYCNEDHSSGVQAYRLQYHPPYVATTRRRGQRSRADPGSTVVLPGSMNNRIRCPFSATCFLRIGGPGLKDETKENLRVDNSWTGVIQCFAALYCWSVP